MSLQSRVIVFFSALFIVTSTALAGGPSCQALMNELTKDDPVLTEEQNILNEIRAQDKALWTIDLQHFYEGAVRFLQKHITGSSVRSTQAEYQRAKINLMHFLKAGKSVEAVDLFRKTFDNVEVSYWMIKQDQIKIAQLQSQPSTPDTKKAIIILQRRLNGFQKKFAEGYGEYIMVRNYIDKIKVESENAIVRETAETADRFLGVHKFSELNEAFKDLRIPEKQVELSEIKKLFRSSPLYIRLKLKMDFRNEIVTFAKYVGTAEYAIQFVDYALSRFKPEIADKLKNAIGLMRSAQLRVRTVPLIVDIESLPNDINLRLEHLRSKNSKTHEDELLVTYARTVDFTDSWNALKSLAETRASEPNNNVHRIFYERMLAAEQRAAALPDISIYENFSNLDGLVTIIHAGIVLKLVGPENYPAIHDFLSFFTGVPGVN